MDACIFWLTLEEEWFERVILSDEKWFVLNAQSPVNRHEFVECKKA